MDKKLKILFIIPSLGHGGAEKVLVNLVNHLNISKYNITVQTIFSGGVNEKYLTKNVRYKSLFSHSFRGNSILLSLIPATWLYQLIIREYYDIIISYLEGPTAHIISGCNVPNTRLIQWIHIELNTVKKIKNGFLFFFQALNFYNKCSKIVCVANSVLKIFEETSKKHFTNATVLYNTIESDKILSLAKEPITDISLSSKILNVCSVAKIIPTKGYDRLVQVHKKLIQEGIEHHIYILGIGPQQAELESFLRVNNLEKSFTFIGYHENPYKYIAACDLYVCSSRREGFSTAVTEALIVGTPVVSTNCSGSYELLGEHNEYGLVVENSEDGIYNGMKQMLTNHELRQHYAQMALERGAKFSCAETVRAVEDLIDNAF